MKKRRRNKWMIALAMAVYLSSFSGLLFIQSVCVEGRLEQAFATFLTVIVALPSVGAVWLLVRGEEEEPDRDAAGDGQTQEQPADTYEAFNRLDINGPLSRREREVAWLLYKGYSNRQIAEALYISETTVKKHVTHIFEKTKAAGRKDYVERTKKR